MLLLASFRVSVRVWGAAVERATRISGPLGGAEDQQKLFHSSGTRPMPSPWFGLIILEQLRSIIRGREVETGKPRGWNGGSVGGTKADLWDDRAG